MDLTALALAVGSDPATTSQYISACGYPGQEARRDWWGRALARSLYTRAFWSEAGTMHQP